MCDDRFMYIYMCMYITLSLVIYTYQWYWYVGVADSIVFPSLVFVLDIRLIRSDVCVLYPWIYVCVSSHDFISLYHFTVTSLLLMLYAVSHVTLSLSLCLNGDDIGSYQCVFSS